MDEDNRIKESIKVVVDDLKTQNYLIEALELPKAKRGHPSVEEHSIGANLLESIIRKYY